MPQTGRGGAAGQLRDDVSNLVYSFRDRLKLLTLCTRLAFHVLFVSIRRLRRQGAAVLPVSEGPLLRHVTSFCAIPARCVELPPPFCSCLPSYTLVPFLLGSQCCTRPVTSCIVYRTMKSATMACL